MRGHRVALTAVLAALVTGCSAMPFEGRSCTLMGGQSGIAIDAPSLALTNDPSTYKATACMADRCWNTRSRQGYALAGLLTSGHAFLANEDLARRTSTPFTLTVVDAKGHEVFRGDATVPLHREDINGHGCGPIVWQGSVTAEQQHRLTVSG